MIYIPKDEWEKIYNHLYNDDEYFKQNLKIIKNVYNIMKFINNKIKNSNQYVLSGSMVYFQKYYLNNNIVFNNYTSLNKLLLISTCLFIATKTTNHLIYLKDIIVIIKEILKKKAKLEINENEIRNKLYEFEFNVLNNLGFELNLDLPYKFLNNLKNFFELNNININRDKLIEICCNYINDIFYLPVCLYYSPNLISISCVKLMQNKLNLHLNFNINDIINLSDYKIDLFELNQCYNLIKKLYD
jgi:hypothetical protein